ncbi:MAG: sigma-54-dependent Fis family transcriptional regulator [Planctomycetes bacterium]|nr:sigma-54-dependent Fis family transcriptional regulator [Planctomycetota bacterium]
MLIKVISAFSEPSLQSKLLPIFNSLDIHLIILDYDGLIWERLIRESADLYIVDRNCLPQDERLEAFQQLPEQPDMIVFYDEDEPQLHGNLMGNGIDSFIDLHLSPELILESLQSIITKREHFESERLARMSIQEPRLSDFVSDSHSMKNLLAVAERVVDSDVSILLLGETGVGKERLARALHNDSQRSQGPFVAINCGGLPENLLESELFGHERGAFTGAIRERKGCFELAHKGTIFLDEIGDMPLHLQVKLLRVLQEKKIKRLGGEQELEVDARVLAATNHDLEAEADNGEFRKDLYYRISVITLTLPSLRERIEDVPELVKNYIKIFRYRLNRPVYGLTNDALDLLLNYSWPGNIRELINAIERAMLLCVNETINTDDLALKSDHVMNKISEDPQILSSTEPPNSDLPDQWEHISYHELKTQLLADFDVRYFTSILDSCRGRVGAAAKMAGIQERSLFDKMRKLGLKKEDYRN